MYTIDCSSDVIRGRNNLGNRHLIENLTKNDVITLIKENSRKFGKPKYLSGMILWSNNRNDTFCFSVYKDNKCLNVTSLEDLKD